MRRVLMGLAFAAAVLVASAPAGTGGALAAAGLKEAGAAADLFHGGGCRKSSPPGQCCHKDHSTGLVHCH